MRGATRRVQRERDARDLSIMRAQEAQRISKMFSRNFRSMVW
jgi:hypothetical protein